MQIVTVAVLGGSGFIGRHLCHLLVSQGYRVRVATRNRERAKEDLILLPTARVDELDVHDARALAGFLRGADAAINLVGVLHEGRGRMSFAAAHTELARTCIAACAEAGVHRLLHMSALGADPAARSRYLATKGEAERLVRESGLAWTVFRPSVVFGPGDGFLSLLARAVRLSPVVPLACPEARFHPVHVRDVAAAFARALPDIDSWGRAYDLCGPRGYTLRELTHYVASLTGRRRLIVGLNDALSYAQARLMELPPLRQLFDAMGMLMTRDDYFAMKAASACANPFPFGIEPTALEAVAPGYLGARGPRARYMMLRRRAGRAEGAAGER